MVDKGITDAIEVVVVLVAAADSAVDVLKCVDNDVDLAGKLAAGVFCGVFVVVDDTRQPVKEKKHSTHCINTYSTSTTNNLIPANYDNFYFLFYFALFRPIFVNSA